MSIDRYIGLSRAELLDELDRIRGVLDQLGGVRDRIIKDMEGSGYTSPDVGYISDTAT